MPSPSNKGALREAARRRRLRRSKGWAESFDRGRGNMGKEMLAIGIAMFYERSGVSQLNVQRRLQVRRMSESQSLMVRVLKYVQVETSSNTSSCSPTLASSSPSQASSNLAACSTVARLGLRCGCGTTTLLSGCGVRFTSCELRTFTSCIQQYLDNLLKSHRYLKLIMLAHKYRIRLSHTPYAIRHMPYPYSMLLHT